MVSQMKHSMLILVKPSCCKSCAEGRSALSFDMKTWLFCPRTTQSSNMACNMAERPQVDQLAFAVCLFLDICTCLQPAVLAAFAADHRLMLTTPAGRHGLPDPGLPTLVRGCAHDKTLPIHLKSEYFCGQPRPDAHHARLDCHGVPDPGLPTLVRGCAHDKTLIINPETLQKPQCVSPDPCAADHRPMLTTPPGSLWPT